ncbi:MAG: SWIM zinc finger family protein [Acetobacteraceae bacterium]|nr:SWIM zinc finger family protein [Acetobacteraceae bacterium]
MTAITTATVARVLSGIKTTPPAQPGNRCRWLVSLSGRLPGVLSINGTPYTVLPLDSGYRLKNHASGAEYDIDTEWGEGQWECSCPDFLYRRQWKDQLGCKHCRALRAGLAALNQAAATNANA